MNEAHWMNLQSRRGFLALIVVQTAHSIEECVFRLFDVFAPARLISGLLTDNLALGFALANAGLVAFGLWCYFARVQPNRESGRAFAWGWTALEFGNGTGHVALAVSQGSYFPGVATAPLLLGVSTYLALNLSTRLRS
jgi:hypothetical protein